MGNLISSFDCNKDLEEENRLLNEKIESMHKVIIRQQNIINKLTRAVESLTLMIKQFIN